MQFVYICRAGENEELRYSLRSVNKFYPNAKVIIAGEAPNWYFGDLIYNKQRGGKYNNATNNIIAACNSDKVEDSFVVMNDDFYILDNLKEIPYFHGGYLLDKIKRYRDTSPRNGYTRKLVQVYQKLRSLGIKRPLDYELHVPFLVEKEKLKIAIGHDPLWRSIYGNIFNIGGEEISDVKVYSENEKNPRSFLYKQKHSPFISSEDKSFIEIKEYIFDKKLSAPSPFEKETVPITSV